MHVTALLLYMILRSKLIYKQCKEQTHVSTEETAWPILCSWKLYCMKKQNCWDEMVSSKPCYRDALYVGLFFYPNDVIMSTPAS